MKRMLGGLIVVLALGVADKASAGKYCTSYDVKVCDRYECCVYRCVYCVDENGVEFYDSCSSGVGDPINCYDKTV